MRGLRQRCRRLVERRLGPLARGCLCRPLSLCASRAPYLDDASQVGRQEAQLSVGVPGARAAHAHTHRRRAHAARRRGVYRHGEHGAPRHTHAAPCGSFRRLAAPRRTPAALAPACLPACNGVLLAAAPDAGAQPPSPTPRPVLVGSPQPSPTRSLARSLTRRRVARNSKWPQIARTYGLATSYICVGHLPRSLQPSACGPREWGGNTTRRARRRGRKGDTAGWRPTPGARPPPARRARSERHEAPQA